MITVPKEWVEQLKLKKGDLVSTEIDEGSLVITPTAPRHVGHSRTIDIDQLKDQRFLDLSITASYIQGNDVTRIFFLRSNSSASSWRPTSISPACDSPASVRPFQTKVGITSLLLRPPSS